MTALFFAAPEPSMSQMTPQLLTSNTPRSENMTFPHFACAAGKLHVLLVKSSSNSAVNESSIEVRRNIANSPGDQSAVQSEAMFECMTPGRFGFVPQVTVLRYLCDIRERLQLSTG